MIFWQGQYFVAHQIKSIQKLWKTSMVTSHFQTSAWGAWRHSLFSSVTAKFRLEDHCPWSVQKTRKMAFIDGVSKLNLDCRLPKKIVIIYVNENTLKMVKNAFYFMWKALLVYEIFTYLSWFFGYIEKWLDNKAFKLQFQIWPHRLDKK